MAFVMFTLVQRMFDIQAIKKKELQNNQKIPSGGFYDTARVWTARGGTSPKSFDREPLLSFKIEPWSSLSL